MVCVRVCLWWLLFFFVVLWLWLVGILFSLGGDFFYVAGLTLSQAAVAGFVWWG